MAVTDINSEDRLVQQTFAEHLEKVLGWESVFVYCYPYHDMRSGIVFLINTLTGYYPSNRIQA